MTRNEILDGMGQNAMMMLHMAIENKDAELALVAQATLTALAAVEHGDTAELTILLMAFTEYGAQKQKDQIENGEMPDSMVEMLKNAGINVGDE